MAKRSEIIFWLKQIDRNYVGSDAEGLKEFIKAEDHKLRQIRKKVTEMVKEKVK